MTHHFFHPQNWKLWNQLWKCWMLTIITFVACKKRLDMKPFQNLKLIMKVHEMLKSSKIKSQNILKKHPMNQDCRFGVVVRWIVDNYSVAKDKGILVFLVIFCVEKFFLLGSGHHDPSEQCTQKLLRKRFLYKRTARVAINTTNQLTRITEEWRSSSSQIEIFP